MQGLHGGWKASKDPGGCRDGLRSPEPWGPVRQTVGPSSVVYRLYSYGRVPNTTLCQNVDNTGS